MANLLSFRGARVFLKKHNIAFAPSKNSQQFIQYAEKLSQEAPSDKYLLSEKSIPHVSLCHFRIDNNTADEVWRMVSVLELPKLFLTFERKRSKFYNGHPQWGGIYWVSLIPNHIERLTEIHLEIAKIIKTPLNAAFADYDPHMTLFNTYAKNVCDSLNQAPQINPPLEDTFNIALGLIDDVGQIIEILYS